MSVEIFKDIGEWAARLAEDKTQIRYLVYRRMYTPREQSAKYADESFYEDDHYTDGIICEVVPLPGGDVLLGIRDVIDGEQSGIKAYYRLSEIRLFCFDCDQPGYVSKDEDGEEFFFGIQDEPG